MTKRLLAMLPLVSLALTVGACSAAPGGDEGPTATSTAEALSMPNGLCYRDAGYGGLPSPLLAPNSIAVYPGSDPNVLAFEHEAWADGGKQTWWMRSAMPGSTGAWLGLDVTAVPQATQYQLTSEWQSVNPVYASHYTCTWNWGDYQLPPGGKKPYVPLEVIVFDPICNRMSCAI